MSRLNNWFISEQIYQYINGSWNIVPEREYFIKCNIYDAYNLYNLCNNRQPEILDSEYNYTNGSSHAKFMMCGGGCDLSTDGDMQSKFKDYYLNYV